MTLYEWLQSEIAGRQPDICIVWLGWRDKDGYGRIKVGGRERTAHRVAYELVHGAVPQGLTLDHLCRTPSCVNPDHLEAVTSAENKRRGYWSIRSACRNGHAFTPDNTRVRHTSQGWTKRECRACDRERTRAYVARKAAA